MKTPVLLASALLALSAHSQAQTGRASDAPGRYQLFQGEYEFVNLKGESHRVRALFKIDTATGAIFICEGQQIDGRHVSPAQPGKVVQRRYCRPFEEEMVFAQ